MTYNPQGHPDKANYDLGLAPGELGQIFPAFNGMREYQVVVLDKKADASSPAGAVEAGQTAYWRDLKSYTVTNDSRWAVGGEKWLVEVKAKEAAENPAPPEPPPVEQPTQTPMPTPTPAPGEGEQGPPTGPRVGDPPADIWRKFVAGVFMTKVTPGNACNILRRGRGVELYAGANDFAFGDGIAADPDPALAAFGPGTTSDKLLGMAVSMSWEPPPDPNAPPPEPPAAGEEAPAPKPKKRVLADIQIT